jgi:hypothetical protein
MFSSRNHWRDRAAEWRAHIANLTFAGAEQNAAQSSALMARRQKIAKQTAWESSQWLASFCQETMSRLMANPKTEISPHVLAPLLRIAGEASKRATTPDPIIETVPDINSDPIVLEFRANLAKAYPDDPGSEPIGGPISSEAQKSDH